MEPSFTDFAAESPAPRVAIGEEVRKERKAKGFLSHYFQSQKEQKERIIVGKTFRLRGDVWVDTAHTEKAILIRIQRNSDAYHALLQAIPQLKPYFDAEERILINLGQYSVEIAPDGKTSLIEEEVQQLLAAWNAL